MQSKHLKIFGLILFYFFNSLVEGYSQDFERDLNVADSLFVNKKFTEAFSIYQAIHDTGEHASPAMLLKMAYIREGLDDISGALYYLNKYYLITKNDKVLRKLEELAKDQNLNGYKADNGSTGIFSVFYYKYLDQIILTLGCLTFGMFLLLMFFIITKKKLVYSVAFGLFFLSISLLYLVNFTLDYNKGILVGKSNYLMSAPSAGSDVIGVKEAGHRVKVNGQKDVWVEIEWEGEVAYVKQSQIMML